MLLWTLAFGLPLSLFEYMYHRYLLHSAILPFLSIMHRSHQDHHGLTYVKAPVKPGSEDMVPVSSEYPVEEEHQEEAMMFPWYALSIFQVIFLILLALPFKLIFPGAPVISGLMLSVTIFYSAYELWHATLHLPFEKYWKPLLESRIVGPMVRYIYSFHLMHHWRPRANLAVVGLWGVALWDHVFRTHARPRHMPLQDGFVNFEDSLLKKPLWPVSLIDAWQPAMYRWSRSVERWTMNLFKRRAS